MALSDADTKVLNDLISTHTAALDAVAVYLKENASGRLAGISDFARMHRGDMTDEIKMMRSWLAGKPPVMPPGMAD